MDKKCVICACLSGALFGDESRMAYEVKGLNVLDNTCPVLFS